VNDSPIQALDVIRYPRDQTPHTTETLLEPTWERLEHELQTMDRYEKPILWLCQRVGIGDSDALAVTGGEGAYHLQIADENSDWLQAVNPARSSEQVELWTSDQGFAPEARFTWDLNQTLEIVRWYFEHGTAHPEITWE
jgi:hypothetical protein